MADFEDLNVDASTFKFLIVEIKSQFSFTIIWHKNSLKRDMAQFLPPANEVAGRLCFQRCFSVHRGVLSLCPVGLCPGVGASVQGVSVRGSLSRGSLSGGLCPAGSLSVRPPYGNERAVHILLKCILVEIKI